MVILLNLMKCLILFLFLLLISFLPVSGQVVNGYFTDGVNNWTSSGDGATQWSEYGGESGSDPAVRLIMSFVKDVAEEKTQTMTQSVDVTGYEHLVFNMKGAMFEQPADNDGYGEVTIGSSTPVYIGNQGWQNYEVDIVGSGVQTLEFELYHWDAVSINYNHDAQIWVDHVQLTDQYLFTLSGYIKNTEGNPVSTYPYLNNSDSTESDDITGYYEFTGLEAGSYLLSINGFVYDEYTYEIDISADTEHNITLTRQSPILSATNINPGQEYMLLTWTRNVVVSDIKVFRGSDTNLIGTVGGGSYLTGYYQDESVTCGTPYNYWLQPFDDAIAGPKYALSDTTDPCDITAVPPVFPVTPTPTETPDDGDDEEEEGLIEIIDEIIDNLIEDVTELFDEALIEPTKVIIEEVVVHVTTTFNWILLGLVYLSVLAGRFVSNHEDFIKLIADTALYGTLAVISILILSFIGFSIIFSNELIAVVIFVVVGFIFGILPEYLKSEDLSGRS